MVNQIGAIAVNNGQTGTADALSLAYIELQKTHLRDLKADGFDNRLNSIVLLTDGLPQSISVWPNNPADNAIKAGTTCVNKTVAALTVPDLTEMRGWIAVSRPFTSTSPPLGLYQLASRDPTVGHDSVWWMPSGAGNQVDLVDPPGAPANDWADAGCGGFHHSASNPSKLYDSTTTDFNRIPTIDAYGNIMGCKGSVAGVGGTCAYKTASDFIDANGLSVTNPLPIATTYDPTHFTEGDHWVLAFWNAADDAGRRIRRDVNLGNRAGDIQNMRVAIYVIGYSGNAPGNDQGLLKRIANDPRSTDFDATQATGLYVQAGNKASLAAAFNTVYNAMLRLAK
jgi:hypothetical protein